MLTTGVRRLIWRSVLVPTLCLAVPAVAAREIGPLLKVAVPRITAVRTASGELTDEVWAGAARVALFDPWKQNDAIQPTEVLLLDTGEALAIRFLAWDDDIRATRIGRDTATYLDDCVELFLGRPEAPLNESVGLEINAIGTLSDFRYREPELLDFGWDATGQTIRLGRLKDDSAGWSATIEWPWPNLRDAIGLEGDGAPARLRANFARWDRNTDGDVFSIWCDSGRPDPKPHRTSRYGWLIFESENTGR